LKASDVPVVLEALKGERIYLVMALALSTGARRSKLLALRWCEVDIKLGAIRIEHSLEQTKAGLRLISPKTKRGRRSISLPPPQIGTRQNGTWGDSRLREDRIPSSFPHKTVQNVRQSHPWG
jgi:integrase